MSEGTVNGMITTNIDLETGIRYGVIQANHVGEAWYEHSQADYGSPQCGWCGTDNPVEQEDGLFKCSHCGKFSGPDDIYREDPIANTYQDQDYTLHQSGDSPYLFVIKSPYFTYCRFCSPCMPGAGNLDSDDPSGIRAYCLDYTWFEDGKAPYTVYSVETGELVHNG